MLRIVCEVHYSNPEGASEGRTIKTFDVDAPEVENWLRQFWPTDKEMPSWQVATVRGAEVLP